MFFAREVGCIADVSSFSPSSEQTEGILFVCLLTHLYVRLSVCLSVCTENQGSLQYTFFTLLDAFKNLTSALCQKRKQQVKLINQKCRGLILKTMTLVRLKRVFENLHGVEAGRASMPVQPTISLSPVHTGEISTSTSTSTNARHTHAQNQSFTNQAVYAHAYASHLCLFLTRLYRLC